MARQYQPSEVNSFVRGLITEASPLTFPDGASIDEVNFELNKDGTRNRRLGLADEGVPPAPITSDLADKRNFSNAFIWEAPGGEPDKSFLVLQDGDDIQIFDRGQDTIGDNLLHTTTPTSFLIGQQYSMASIDGVLVVATGGAAVYKVEYDAGVFVDSVYRLQLRDVFGIEDSLFTGMDITERPSVQNDEHIYNLRNQTWAVPRVEGNLENLADPISVFVEEANAFPSNVDTVNQALYADSNDSNDRLTRRFFAQEVFKNPLGTVEAPKGYFIIDALERGISRRRELERLMANNPQLDYPVSSAIPADTTEQGPTAVAEYSGRVWYSGFGSEAVGTDIRSPRLSSYILFSQLVRDSSNFPACYQSADPTNPDDFELADTDGGFIRIEEAVNIRKLVALDRILIVLADNGVWTVEGGSDFGFTATNYMVRKITDRGIAGTTSAVTVDKGLFYWSDSALIALQPSDLGGYTPADLTNTTIKALYDTISYDDKISASGSYDSYEQKLRWVYGGNSELIFDLNLQAFYINKFSVEREVRSVFTVPSYREGAVSENVTVEGEVVTVLGENVVITTSKRLPSVRETKYTAVTSDGVTFATLSDPTFRDWGTDDAAAYLITGYMSAGDFQRNKQVPYLTLHFRRTETGLDEEFNLTGESGCKVRAAWDWANSPNSNRWGREFQGYRYRRYYIPQDENDPFDTGFETITTKNKLRGKGRVLSLQFSTEPGKDCYLLGWSMITGINGNV